MQGILVSFALRHLTSLIKVSLKKTCRKPNKVYHFFYLTCRNVIDLKNQTYYVSARIKITQITYIPNSIILICVLQQAPASQVQHHRFYFPFECWLAYRLIFNQIFIIVLISNQININDCVTALLCKYKRKQSLTSPPHTHTSEPTVLP